MGTRPYQKAADRGFRLAVLVAALFGCATTAQAQSARQQQGTVGTVILRQLSFVKTDDLDFGSLIAGTAGGTVRLQPNGTRTTTGTVTLVGGGQQTAGFAGFGSNNQQVLISLSSNTIQLTGPGAPMTVSAFEIGSTPTAILSTVPQRFRINSATGLFSFPVGATLTVNPNQASGTYTGTWQITLNYQ
jgi:hypothetical protein